MLKSERIIPISLSGSTNRSTNRSTSYYSRINPNQIARLEKEFAKNKLIHATDLELLAAEMALNEKDVQAWYTDRLAAWRREQGLSDII